MVKTWSVACSAAVVLALAASGACSRQSASSSGAPASSAAAGTPAADNAAAAKMVTGEVLETMNASNYTYMRLKTPQGEVWAATGQFDVKVGDKIVGSFETEMRDFHSPTLNRDFPVIDFLSHVRLEGQPEGQAAAQGEAPPMAVGHGAGGMLTPSSMKVDPIAPPAGGSSIADVWAKRASLAGRMVTVRGKVVKYNGGILGRNWIHLQDGSGSAASGTNDMAVTTSAPANLGDVITVTGKLALDKDIGAGYVYKVLIEDATIK